VHPTVFLSFYRNFSMNKVDYYNDNDNDDDDDDDDALVDSPSTSRL